MEYLQQENDVVDSRKYGDISIFTRKDGSVIVAFTTGKNGDMETHTFSKKDITATHPGFGYLCVSSICILPDGSKGDTFSEWIEDRILSDAEIIEKAKGEIYKKHRIEVAEKLDLGPEILMTGKSLILFREDGKYIIRNPGNLSLNEKNVDLQIDLSDTFSETEGQFEIARILTLIETELIKRKSCLDREETMCQIEKIGIVRGFVRDIEKNLGCSEINTLAKSLTNEKKGVQDIWSFIYANLDQNRV